MSKLTPEQAQVVETWGQGVAVMAGAGSGKTHTLRAKVRALLERQPEAKFAAVSFTEKSANDLHEKLTALSLELQGRPLMGHVVTTIHGLCSSILREFPQEAGFDGDEAMFNESEASSLWQQALDQLWFEMLPPEIEGALGSVLKRMDRKRMNAILSRMKSLESMGPAERTKELDLAAVYLHCLDRYDRMKRRQGALDFDDLEQGALRALEHEHVRAEFHRRFELVMVDEFQDTNPVQARILRFLSRPGMTNLCVVGDPKQSIYRFRDADVSVFDAFCRELGVQVKLTRNFRSRPGILEFCNEVCEPIFAASELPYDALEPQREVHPDLPPVVSISVSDPAGFAAWLIEERKKIDLSEMALLLRKVRGGSEKWIRALMNAGIPVAVESGGLLWKDPRPRELVMLLRWWSNPLNELSAVGFLRSPWVGIEDRVLDEWRKTDRSFVGPFFESENPVALALRGLWMRREAVRPAEVLAQLLYVRELEAEMGAQLLGLWHRAEEMSLAGLGFKEVVQQLSRAMDEERRERDVPPSKNQGQLRVLTIHGSKGLEFKHVLLLDFAEKKQRAPNMPLMFWDRERGIFLPERDEEDQVVESAEYEEWKGRELRDHLAEVKRVFYVALTRAEDRLVLVLPTKPEVTDLASAKEEKPKKAKKPSDPTMEDFWRKWCEKALAKWPQESWMGRRPASNGGQERRVAVFALPERKPEFAARRPRHSVSEWNLLSKCPRQFQWKVIEKLPTEEEAPEWIQGAKRGARVAQNEIGTQVHRCLELGDTEALRELEQKLGSDLFQAEPLIRWMQSSEWMQDERPGREIWKEFAFEIPVEDEALVGAMDRLVVDREGDQARYTIVDFKVTSRGKEPAQLIEEYQTQLGLYAWALGSLESGARQENTRAILVQISASRVEEIEVPLGMSQLRELKTQASRIVQGWMGEPKPGKICRHCDFRKSCEVAAEVTD